MRVVSIFLVVFSLNGMSDSEKVARDLERIQKIQEILVGILQKNEVQDKHITIMKIHEKITKINAPGSIKKHRSPLPFAIRIEAYNWCANMFSVSLDSRYGSLNIASGMLLYNRKNLYIDFKNTLLKTKEPRSKEDDAESSLIYEIEAIGEDGFNELVTH